MPHYPVTILEEASRPQLKPLPHQRPSAMIRSMPHSAFAAIFLALALSVASAGTVSRMNCLKTFFSVIGSVLLAPDVFSGDSSAISNTVETVLSNYAALCEQAVERLPLVCTETNILDVHVVYFAGWIHATNAIPCLLDIVSLPGANESGTRRIAKRVPGSSINPIPLLSGPYPPASPTPAAGALAALPVEFSVLTNLIEQSTTNTNRAEMLAWTAMVRFGDSFGSVLEQKAVAGLTPWHWIQGIRTNEWESSPSVCLNRYQPHFPIEAMTTYTNQFHLLRNLAIQCESDCDAETLEYVKDALKAIGHPYDEDSWLWPQ